MVTLGFLIGICDYLVLISQLPSSFQVSPIVQSATFPFVHFPVVILEVSHQIHSKSKSEQNLTPVLVEKTHEHILRNIYRKYFFFLVYYLFIFLLIQFISSVAHPYLGHDGNHYHYYVVTEAIPILQLELSVDSCALFGMSYCFVRTHGFLVLLSALGLFCILTISVLEQIKFQRHSDNFLLKNGMKTPRGVHQ